MRVECSACQQKYNHGAPGNAGTHVVCPSCGGHDYRPLAGVSEGNAKRVEESRTPKLLTEVRPGGNLAG